MDDDFWLARVFVYEASNNEKFQQALHNVLAPMIAESLNHEAREGMLVGGQVVDGEFQFVIFPEHGDAYDSYGEHGLQTLSRPLSKVLDSARITLSTMGGHPDDIASAVETTEEVISSLAREIDRLQVELEAMRSAPTR